MSENKSLFSQFPPVTKQEWMDQVISDLKGADFEKKLVWKSKEGISVLPFYREEDLGGLPHMERLPGEFPFVRGGERLRNSWYVRQDIRVGDLASANRKALDILNRGVDSLGFIFEPDVEYNVEMMNTLFKGIFPESIELNLYPQGSAIELMEAFVALLDERGAKKDNIKGCLEADPLGKYMLNGKLCIAVEDGIKYLEGLIGLAGQLPAFRLLRVNGANFNNAGATVVQELAMALSMASDYMSRLSDSGVDPSVLAKKIGFTFGVGSNYFFEIAKFRAARMLWATIVKKYGVDDEAALQTDIHAVTSEWNKTVYDPYVNMLRTQTEAMSATLGGVNSLTVKAFDSVFRESNEFGERIARNQQLLLKEEAHFEKIVDPAAGSYYIENLTSMLAGEAWDLFIEIEKRGGFLEALRAGYIQDEVEKTASLRNTNVARGREKLLGTNSFPNTKEKRSEELPAKKDPGQTEIRPVKIYRAAEMFEELRYAVDNSDKIPKVFMLTVGNPVMRKARAQFSSGFFAVAGYEIIDNIGFDTLEDGVNAALKAKADIVVLCSSDEEYADAGPGAHRLLGDKSLLVIAGEPACEKELRDAGIEYFISMRSDLLSTLSGFNKVLGINR